jgi:ABC-type lipoprotein export system ATPase subunit
MSNERDQMTQDEQLETLIARFNGDVDAAVKALMKFANDKQKKNRPARATSEEIVIKTEGLKKTYRVGKQTISALDGVSLEVHKGEIVAFTGASGSGKSTLLQLIGGLDKPTAGTVTIHDKDISRLSDRRLSMLRNSTIGFIFQFFYLQPFLKLRQNLEVAGIPLRTKPSERRSRVQQLAEVVGLSDRLNHFPKELSGGQMQRAAIARALLNKPSILLADEPTGNLDSATGSKVEELLFSFNKELGATLVVVTHDAELASKCDIQIFIKDGHIEKIVGEQGGKE